MNATRSVLLVSLCALAFGCRPKQSAELLAQSRARQADAGPGAVPSPPSATLLTYGQNVPRDLVQDEDWLYWRNEGTRAEGEAGIFKVSKRGGAAVRLVSEKGIHALVADATSLYWVNPAAGTVQRVSKDGVSITPVATDQENLCCLAVDDTQVYWASAEAIFRAPKEGGNAQTVHADLSLPSEIAVDGSALWWYSAISGKLARSPKQRGPVKPVASEDATLHAFLLDDTHVYWSFGSAKKMQIRRQLKSGGVAETLVTGEDPPVELFLGRDDVWWTTGDDIRRVPKSGGAVVKVVEGTDRALALAADDRSVYWTDRLGRVQSAPRK